ncbi:phage major capsid protein [Roseinatronobacter bogoriensis]|uniref:Phage major capsid protein n=1 Tax=Roseinatronobacter bogoriensis subsp. barguzinensis TaxID=441209 RepID=A0A2K8KES4_9RHOB|nr:MULTISPECIES: phage major capsid protein [Rhodobaca]ATX66245.1 phage major capsid protein [Rhodobaca barguzinensis]MBB4207362.1 HK97 family phage major capsid protein [Rhodobaca bogoriensis DSM 18756]TDW40331.1 HK97 family phage major capsid protein [Rhodobaca barguzinensis]TDY70517.1 HK97 family phage major capsid protein [Rhodobaca bogoriensis DSM 18756]
MKDDIVTELKAASDRVKDMDARLAYLEKAEAKSQTPAFYRGGGVASDGMEWKDANVADFLRKNALPAGMETKDLSITADGQGVTVRGDWSGRIFKLIRESSPMRQVASVMNTSSNALEVLVDRAEPQSAWVNETAARDETAASFLSRHSIPVFEHYALPVATQHLLEDSEIDVETWLQGKIATRFGRQESNAFFNGNGTGEPKGILTYDFVPDADHVWGADPAAYTIGAIYSGVDGDITNGSVDGAAALDTLGDLVDALKAEYLPNASFLMTRAMRNKLRKLRDAENRPFYQPSLSEAIPDRLMGYPVRLAEDMGALDTDVAGILFGDFGEAYTVADRVGISIIRDQITRPGFVRWYARKRLGGALTNPEAVKALILGSEPE